MSRVGIDRLPVRRLSNEPKEAMNCKSCRKRKIKCNRLRPSCEACQIFGCPCIYDAVPKKRGPKTDVLEALVKRVNQMERALEAEGKAIPPQEKAQLEEQTQPDTGCERGEPTNGNTPQSAIAAASTTDHNRQKQQQQLSYTDMLPGPMSPVQPPITHTNALLNVYFTRLHNKPYYILDEAATRQRLQNGQLPLTIMNGLWAVTARYAPHLAGGYNSAVKTSDECAIRARAALDVDEPSIENVQVSLLLSLAYFQAGKGKKSYMLLSSAISMAFAQNLHRELPAVLRLSPNEREGRRRLFWTCYIMDRFVACGSKRPSLIGDEAISLRLPAWHSDPAAVPFEGNYFCNGTNAPLTTGSGRIDQGSASMLIEIVRVLGITNRYLLQGGLKGDSHFPWHSQSNLSRIRQSLDAWAANSRDAFSSLEALFGQPESSTLVLSKLIYHLIHCLIYRPFLPIDLTELAETGQHQSWQMEATNLCFLHANAVAELVEIGRGSSLTDWPAFVGYCLCTAGTVHVHGAHYTAKDGDVFARSAEFLSREMAQLSDLRITWAGVQHQRETLQTVYGFHSQLVKSLASNPLRFSPVFQMEDFFDRYPGQYIDGAHVTFSEIIVDSLHESIPAYDVLKSGNWHGRGQHTSSSALHRPEHHPYGDLDARATNRKRRRTTDEDVPPEKNQSNGPDSKPVHTTSPDQASATPSIPSQFQATMQDTVAEPHLPNHGSLSPLFNLSPWPAYMSHAPNTLDAGQAHLQLDNMFSLPSMLDQQTPGGISANGSSNTEGDKDPFMSLLEQLAENEHSHGGPSDLGFFLGG